MVFFDFLGRVLFFEYFLILVFFFVLMVGGGVFVDKMGVSFVFFMVGIMELVIVVFVFWFVVYFKCDLRV